MSEKEIKSALEQSPLVSVGQTFNQIASNLASEREQLKIVTTSEVKETMDTLKACLRSEEIIEETIEQKFKK